MFNRQEHLRNLGFTIIGGIGLIIATAILQIFFSTPPSRAEFDKFKTETKLMEKHLGEKLDDLKQGQSEITKELRLIRRKL